jgi:hypothetical protein
MTFGEENCLSQIDQIDLRSPTYDDARPANESDGNDRWTTGQQNLP